VPLAMNRFFIDLGLSWTRAAATRDAAIEPPEVDGEVAFELLELARVAAHDHERRFAPLSCYLAGIAAERLRGARPGTTSADLAAYISEVRQSLESRSAPE
jgi:Domain of unknown function (DUF6457)